MKNERSVLIVEDDPDIQLLLRELLETEGYQVSAANNGREAIEQLSGSVHLPGLILLDLMMPDLDGYGFRQEQQKHPRLASIPIVVMSADGHAENKIARLNAKAYLKKPFTDLDQLLNTISSFFP